MALLDILHFPDPRLHLIATPVEKLDNQIKTVVRDMAETMYKNDGIGLAATQVNIQKRIFIMDISKDSQNLLTYINPEIIDRRGNVIGEEGCLSVPGVYEKVIRAEWIKVRSLNINGETIITEHDGLMAVCIQHEIDHLDGKVFVEYLSNLKQNFIKKKMKKIIKPK